MDYISSRCGSADRVMMVRVNTKGCSGHKYEYSMVGKGDLAAHDEMVEWQGGGIAIDSRSLIYLLGSTLDVKSDISGTALVWNNPNAQNLCGCGESFALKTC